MHIGLPYRVLLSTPPPYWEIPRPPSSLPEVPLHSPKIPCCFASNHVTPLLVHIEKVMGIEILHF